MVQRTREAEERAYEAEQRALDAEERAYLAEKRAHELEELAANAEEIAQEAEDMLDEIKKTLLAKEIDEVRSGIKDANILIEQKLQKIKELDPNITEYSSNNYAFNCPIHYGIMLDPVVIESGHTLDRQSMYNSFKISRKNPITRDYMISLKLIPNITVRNLILDELQAKITQLEEKNKISHPPILPVLQFTNNDYTEPPAKKRKRQRT